MPRPRAPGRPARPAGASPPRLGGARGRRLRRDPLRAARRRRPANRREFDAIGHRRGIVATANSGRPGGASFFIGVADHPEPDGSDAIFGNVIAGMDVADRIFATPRDVYGRHGPPDRPSENVVMKRVRIERVGAAAESAPSAVAP
jgi:cyclophilin family peptidyl-prolyl cis-trans isomerase